MKRRVALILALAMVSITLFAGCGSGNGGSNTSAGGSDSASATAPSAPAAEPTKTGGPNAKADGSTDLENIGFYDPDFDYASSGEPFKLKYMTGFTGPLYDDVSIAIEHWAKLVNIQYDGYFSSNGDTDMFLNQLQTYLDQGYDGILMDPDTTIYPAILEKMDAHPEVQWMGTMSPVRDTSSNADPQPLKRPFVGHEHYRIGTYMMDKCLEYGAEAWPDVDMKDVGVIVADYSIVAALHDRQRGAYDTWVAKYPEYEDHFFTLDCASGGMDADTARNIIQPVMSTNSQFTRWMIIAVHEDYAIGASAAVDSLGLTPDSVIVDMGGSGLVKIFDAGVEDAWRFADYTAQTIYLEPIMGAMYAFMAGYATPQNIWPQWINAHDHGENGDTYAGYLLPLFWLDKDNYKEYLAWSDVYAYADSYPQYPRDGITRDLYSTVVPVPDYYK